MKSGGSSRQARRWSSTVARWQFIRPGRHRRSDWTEIRVIVTSFVSRGTCLLNILFGPSAVGISGAAHKRPCDHVIARLRAHYNETPLIAPHTRCVCWNPLPFLSHVRRNATPLMTLLYTDARTHSRNLNDTNMLRNIAHKRGSRIV